MSTSTDDETIALNAADNNNEYRQQTTDKLSGSESTPLVGGVVVYRRRWLMLLIFSLNTAMNGCLFMAVSPINDIVRKYYNIRSTGVEWLSNMCVVSYVFLALPATYLMNRWGIRPLMFVASTCNFLATALHFAGYQKTKFPLVLLGQAFTAIAYSTIIQMPGKLSSLWFPEHERATSTAIGVVMNLFGVAIGFIQPSMMVMASNNNLFVEGELKTFYISQMVVGGVILLATLFYREQPPTPPSHKQHDDDDEQSNTLSFIASLKLLAQNKYFIFLSQSYALYFALFVAIFVLVNPMVTEKFVVGYQDNIGWMGFWNNMVAIVSFLVIGRLLDRTKKYQLTAVLLNVVSMVLWLCFILVLTYANSFTAVYVIFLTLGLSFVPFFATGIETAAEMTYPVSEETSSSVMLVLGNVYAAAMIYGFGMLVQAGHTQIAGYVMVGLYGVSSVMACLAKTDLKRSQALNSS